MNKIFVKKWEDLELKDRMRHIASVLNAYLSTPFNTKAEQVISIANQLRKTKHPGDGYLAIFLPQIIESNGLEFMPKSCYVFESITDFTTCEFAVRPFIEKYPVEMMQQMLNWTKHTNEHVRRLSSEGCRPVLPWGGVLQDLKDNPTPILPILENLKNDDSECVRRSVTNNLNDISKNNPEVLLGLYKKWKKAPEKTQALLKHASRTLLKAGNKHALNYFGWFYDEDLQIKNLDYTKKVPWSGKFEFSFSLLNKSNTSRKVRLEYAIYFLKANGTQSKKVFQISNFNLPTNEEKWFQTRFSFKPITTRTYHSGSHGFSLIVNGNEINRVNFLLKPVGE